MNSAAWRSLPASACTLQTAGTAGNDRITKTSYDAAGQVTSVVEGLGTAAASTTMTATYSNNGQQLTVKDGENNLTTYEYDGFDRLSKTRFPNASKGAGSSSTTDYIQNSYDANGNVTNVRLRDGQNIGFSYDNLNRLTLKDRPGSEPDVSYSYDLLGRLTGASQTGQALTFGYDALGRNISQGGPLGTVQMQYDLAGHRTGITWPDGFQVAYSYDDSGAMGGIYDSSSITASFSYDNLGRHTVLNRISNASTYFGYDAASRLSGLTHDLAGTGNDLSLGFSYNPAGQITQKTASNTLYSWQGHVNANRAYAANGRNQYTSAGTTSFGYDARGNLTTSGSSGYGYNSENYLTSGPNASLSYDPLGRLYQVTSSSTNTRFLYAGTELIGEYNSAGTVLRRYVHGPGADEPIVRYEEAGLAHRWFLHADERGSVVSMSDGAGSMFQINSYDEYGIPGAGNGGRFQYTGQTWIPELGMYYYKARFYSPTLGRFMQTDPIGYVDGMNLYTYVGNDPVNATDPSGTQIVVTGTTGAPYGGYGGYTPQYGQSRPSGGSESSLEPSASDCDTSHCFVVQGKRIRANAIGTSAQFAGGAFGGGSNGSTSTPGIGHNQPPPEEEIVVNGIRFALSRMAGAVLLLIIPTVADAPAPLYQVRIDDKHVTPHLKKFQHPKDEVYRAVFQRVAPMRGHTPINTPFRGNITIGSTNYRFHAYTRPNGDINIGTIYVP